MNTASRRWSVAANAESVIARMIAAHYARKKRLTAFSMRFSSLGRTGGSQVGISM
jgi:hypothetical protein